MVASNAYANTIVWTNTLGGNWGVATNWSPNQIPGSSDTAVITNNGTYAVTLNTSTTVGSLTLGGTSGTQTLTNAGNTLTFNNASAVNTNGVLDLGGGSLSGGGLLTINGQFNWTSGSIASGSTLTVATNGTLVLAGNNGSDYSMAGILTNAGTIGVVSGNLQLQGSGCGGIGELVNLPGAVLNLQTNVNIDSCGSGLLVNQGTVEKTGGTGTSSINVLLDNTGLLDVRTGTVNVNGGDSTNSTGVFQTESGATLVFVNNFTAYSGVQFVGGGTNILTGGTFTLDGLVTISNLTLAGASLTGTNGVISGVLTWTSGSIASGSTLTVATNGTLVLAGNNGSDYEISGILTNAGTVRLVSGNLSLNANCNNGQLVFVNLPGALVDITTSISIDNNCGIALLVNQGTVRKSGGTGTSTINPILDNTGLLDVQTGMVSLNGAYTLSGGKLNFGLNSSTNFGRINLSGSPAALAGSLSANFNFGYSAVAGDSFGVVTYNSGTGVFSTLYLPAESGWQSNYVAYGPTVATIVVGSIYKLVFTGGPVGTNAGAVFAPIVVQVEDSSGNPFATNGIPVTIALNSGSGTLIGTLTQNTGPTGKATFNDLSINVVGSKTLRAISTQWLMPGTSSSIAITPAAASQLALVPAISSPQIQGTAFSPAPVIQVLDQFGNVVPGSTLPITARLSSGGGGGLTGTVTVNANGVNGLAVFNNLQYNLASPSVAESVVVYFTSPGLQSVTNNAIMVDFVFGLITLTNGNSVIQIDPTTQNGMLAWTVDGTDQLYQHWFWLRQGGSGQQISFDQLGTPLGFSYTSSNASILYQTPGLNVTLGLTLRGGTNGSFASEVAETVTVQNTNSSPLTLHVFDYADFDLAGDPEGDMVSFPTTNSVIQRGKGMMVTQTVQTPTANEWEASWYAITLDKLIEDSSVILSDEIIPAEPGDQTFTYQWDVTLSAGQTMTMSLTDTIQPASVVLNIVRSGGSIVISWPTNSPSVFQLQSSAVLGLNAAWTTVTNHAPVVGGQFQITEPFAGNTQFFRLKY